MTWTELALGALLLAAPAWMLVRFVADLRNDLKTNRAAKQQAERREALRTPAPDTQTVSGWVVSGPPHPTIVKRRQHGCLGGPLRYDVAEFWLELDEGRRERVWLGPDPVVENEELLEPAPSPEPTPTLAPAPPLPTGAPDAEWVLRGRVQVAGLVREAGRLCPPPDHSAVLTILEAPRVRPGS